MPSKISTARGVYSVASATHTEQADGATIITLAAERADGVERVAFRCSIDNTLAAGRSEDELIVRLAPWLELEFETVRETALKTMRSERRLHQFVFDLGNRGPFT